MNTDFILTRIRNVIYEETPADQPAERRFSPELPCAELIFHFRSDATVYFGDSVLVTGDDCVRFLPAGTASRYIVKKNRPQRRDRYVDIFFETDRPVSDRPFCVMPPDAVRLGALFRRIATVWVARREGYAFEALSLLYQIFAELQKARYLPQEKIEQIDPAIREIEANFRSPFDADRLCALCGISYSYLKRLFVRKTGLSPKQYALELRLNYAKSLLETGRYTVGRVAELSGYHDASFFCRQFRQHVGVTPHRYRRPDPPGE